MGISSYASASLTSFRGEVFAKDDIQKALDKCFLMKDRVFVTELIYGAKIDFSVDYNIAIGIMPARCTFGYETYSIGNPDEEAIIKKCIEDHQVEAKLTDLCLNSREGMVLRGTIIGPGIRSNKYNLKKPTLVIYDCVNTDIDIRSKFLDLSKLCEELDFMCVPVIKVKNTFTYEPPKNYSGLVEELKNVKSKLNKDIDVSGVRLLGVSDTNLRFSIMHRDLCLSKVI